MDKQTNKSPQGSRPAKELAGWEMMRFEKKQSRRTFCLAMSSLLGGCEFSGSAPARVALAPGIAMNLPAPGELGRNVEAAQLIEVEHADQRFVFEGRLSVTARRLLLVAVDSLGRRALTAEWSGVSLDAQAAPWVPKLLRPANIVADITLLYWPEAALQRALQPAGASLVTRPGGRAVVVGNRDILRLQYRPDQQRAWNGSAVCENLGWGYRLTVRSSEIAA